MNQISRAKMVIYLAAIFAAGVLAGGYGGYAMTHRERVTEVRPETMKARIQREMQAKLRLTPEQAKLIEPSVQAVCGELRAIGYTSAVETGRAFDRFNQRIAGFLSAEQEAELERLQRERKESVRRRCKSWTNSGPTSPTR